MFSLSDLFDTSLRKLIPKCSQNNFFVNTSIKFALLAKASYNRLMYSTKMSCKF